MKTARVATRLTADGVVRIAYSTSSDLSNPSFSTATLSQDQCTINEIHNLVPGTRYYYAPEVNGVINTSAGGSFKAMPDAGVPANFYCIFGSCAYSSSNSTTFSTIQSLDPDFFIHTGDLHYDDLNDYRESVYHHAADKVLEQPRQKSLYSNVPLYYMWDDHDCTNTDSGAVVGQVPARRVNRMRYPRPPYGDPNPEAPIYHSFVVGRARFIMSDLRSERDKYDSTDGPNKTNMGVTQKQWFKDECLAAVAEGQFIVWISTYHWIASVRTGADGWGWNRTERTEIANFIKDNDLTRRFMCISGDMHASAIDTGINTDYATDGGAGFPLIQAAPLDRGTSVKGGPYSMGPFTGSNQQFGSMWVTDTGNDIINIKWQVRATAGNVYAEHEFTVDVGV